jgi:hypothetical protein
MNKFRTADISPKKTYATINPVIEIVELGLLVRAGPKRKLNIDNPILRVATDFRILVDGPGRQNGLIVQEPD